MMFSLQDAAAALDNLAPDWELYLVLKSAALLAEMSLVA